MLSAADIDGFLLDVYGCVEPSHGPNDDEPVSIVNVLIIFNAY